MTQLLYHLKTDSISVTIEAYFENDKLIIDGYDIGKTVDEVYGDSDYEYSMTLPPESVEKVYTLFNVQVGLKEDLLKAMAARYNDNFCYSNLMKLFSENGIKFDSFSWT